jgi:hypothetical protein
MIISTPQELTGFTGILFHSITIHPFTQMLIGMIIRPLPGESVFTEVDPGSILVLIFSVLYGLDQEYIMITDGMIRSGTTGIIGDIAPTIATGTTLF